MLSSFAPVDEENVCLLFGMETFLLVNRTELVEAAERVWYTAHIMIPSLWYHSAVRGSMVMFHRGRNSHFGYRLGIIGEHVHHPFGYD